MEKEENILGYEKIGKLIRKFSIPCIISLLVNSLYNIVDQIFIGWGVGYLGNGATNVVFPLTMICLAFALMFGDGASAYLSLKLGQKKNEEAANRYAEIASFIGLSGATTEEKVDSLIAELRSMNDQLDIPQGIKNYGKSGVKADTSIIDEKEFLEKLPEVAKNAIADACTGSNPRQPSQEEMEKLLKACYYDTEIDF